MVPAIALLTAVLALLAHWTTRPSSFSQRYPRRHIPNTYAAPLLLAVMLNENQNLLLHSEGQNNLIPIPEQGLFSLPSHTILELSTCLTGSRVVSERRR